MSDKDTSGPAFPGAWREDVNDGFISGSESGMTLRDYFAAKAMQGLIPGYGGAEVAALAAYRIADAMLKAREE